MHRPSSRQGPAGLLSGRDLSRRFGPLALWLVALAALTAAAPGTRRGLIEFVADRPGHDWRYAIDASRITSQLGWQPSVTFEAGLARTVAWYLDNEWWWRPLTVQRYDGQRLGTAVSK